MKEIDNFIGKLSPEERRLHKSLIDECRKREKEIADNEKNALENAGRLVELSEKLLDNLETLRSQIDELKDLSDDREKKTEKTALGMIPNDRFFHA